MCSAAYDAELVGSAGCPGDDGLSLRGVEKIVIAFAGVVGARGG